MIYSNEACSKKEINKVMYLWNMMTLIKCDRHLKNICMDHGLPQWFTKCCKFLWSSINFNRSNVITNVKLEISKCITQVKDCLSCYFIEYIVYYLCILKDNKQIAKNKLKKKMSLFLLCQPLCWFFYTYASVLEMIIFFKNI